MGKVTLTVCMLVCSNVFMTFAWYGLLKHLGTRPWLLAAVARWGIAFFEYLLQVPANRIGHTVLDLGQLKILQEVIPLSVCVPFSVLDMREPLRRDFLWASFCILGTVSFIFRSHG